MALAYSDGFGSRFIIMHLFIYVSVSVTVRLVCPFAFLLFRFEVPVNDAQAVEVVQS